jgi:DHA2 family multidrug resistance protein
LASKQSHNILDALVRRQAAMLAYIDDFKILAISALCMVPLTLLMRKSKPGGEMHVR